MTYKKDWKSRRKGMVAGIALGIMSLFTAPALAEYPEKAIQIIYPFSAGGSGDALVRLFANAVQKHLGVEVVVVNTPGAGGNTGFSKVARETPDGYTLLSLSPSFTINATLFADPGFDPVEDFDAVTSLSVVPNILVVPTDSQFQTVQELIDYAKAHPGELSFGSSGLGTSIHLAGEMLKREAGVDILHIPYPGAANAVADLMGGRLDFIFDSSSSSLPNITGGKVRALAIAADERLDELPDVPTMAEAGFPTVQSSAWTGLVAPKGTPKPVIDKLHAAFQQVLQEEEVLEILTKRLGGRPFSSTPEEFATFIAEQVEANRLLIESLGMDKL